MLEPVFNGDLAYVTDEHPEQDWVLCVPSVAAFKPAYGILICGNIFMKLPSPKRSNPSFLKKQHSTESVVSWFLIFPPFLLRDLMLILHIQNILKKANGLYEVLLITYITVLL